MIEINKIIDLKWIGEIPKKWNLIRGKFLFNSKKEINNNLKCKNLLSLTLNGVLNKDLESSEGLRPEDYESYQIFQKDDLVFKMIDLANVKTSRVGIVHEEGIMSPVYLRQESIKQKIFPKFAYWFYYDLYKKEIYNSIGSGVRSTLSSSDILDLYLPVPPVQEQKLISQYLDKKTEKISTLIEKIKKKIELFKEQRASMINQFVTKGLYPNAEMKDSGVDWIGDIPKHWEVSKLKYLSSVELSTVDRHKYENEKKVSICHYTDTYKNEFIDRNTTLPIGTCKEIEIKKFALQKKDIILTKDSESPDDIGIPTFVLEDLENTVCGYHLALVKTKDDSIIPEFLYRYIESKSVRDYFFISSNGITRFGLGKSSIRELIVVIPPKEEQVLIIKKIQSNSKHINEMIKKLLKKIELLKEYNQSILSSVVTGKIRVSADKI